MKIVLVRFQFAVSKLGLPIGLVYLERALKNEDHDVIVYDINLDLGKAVSQPLDGYARDFVLPENCKIYL